MSNAELRREIKKAIDKLPRQRLESLADYVRFLNRPNLKERITIAEQEFAAGRGVSWRKARRNV